MTMAGHGQGWPHQRAVVPIQELCHLLLQHLRHESNQRRQSFWSSTLALHILLFGVQGACLYCRSFLVAPHACPHPLQCTNFQIQRNMYLTDFSHFTHQIHAHKRNMLPCYEVQQTSHLQCRCDSSMYLFRSYCSLGSKSESPSRCHLVLRDSDGCGVGPLEMKHQWLQTLTACPGFWPSHCDPPASECQTPTKPCCSNCTAIKCLSITWHVFSKH